MGDFDPADEAFASFRNRHDLKVFVKIITPTDRPIRGNAFLAHGFSDVHDTGHMRALTSAGVRSGYRVIVWDATHSWGRRSEGEPGEATFYYHHADLEDVLEWSHTQAWYERQFVLMGFKPGRYDGRRV